MIGGTSAVLNSSPDGPSHSPPTGAVVLFDKLAAQACHFGYATIVLSVAVVVVVLFTLW